MKLRTRLFVWVGSLFVIAFITSFIFEGYFTRTSVMKAQGNIELEINRLNEKRRRHFQDYLVDILGKTQAKINALLIRVGESPNVREGFAPTLHNYRNNSWLHSASLIVTNDWIDVLQNLNEGHVASAMTMDDPPMRNTFKVDVDTDFAIVGVEENVYGKKKWLGPYIGIRLDMGIFEEPYNKNPPSGSDTDDTEYYVLFSPHAVINYEPKNITELSHLHLSIDLSEPFLRWVKLTEKENYLIPFLKQVERVQKTLQKDASILPQAENWESWFLPRLHKSVNLSTEIHQYPADFFYEEGLISKDFTVKMDADLARNLNRYDKVGMIWRLTTFFLHGSFGVNPFSKTAPFGIVNMNFRSSFGKAVISNQMFYPKPLLSLQECQSYFKLHHDSVLCLAEQLQVIVPVRAPEFYFANTLRIQFPEKNNELRQGFLTIGVNGRELLKELAEAIHETTVFISDNRVIEVFSAEGIRVANEDWYQLPIHEVTSEKTGVISIGNREFYFLHMEPYKDLDFHFIIFNPRDEEFAFINKLNTAGKNLITHLSLNIRLTFMIALIGVLIMLHNIARRITNPITHLANATKAVKDGNLEDIIVPEVTSKRNDEIAELYNNYLDMLKGLREKERVRGILNKVVSQEIAEETLKGNVKLGGEEKQVTVLFADIRHFTSLTEHMAPQDVILLINTCMTKISEIIDRYGGVIDKFVGDEVMALFGAPVAKEGCTLKAVQCAVDIMTHLNEWNIEREQQNQPKIKIGIGIHTGMMVAGNMGAENRLNYTVLGSNVNLASRLCGAAEESQILISDATLNEPQVKESIVFHSAAPLKLKGFTDPVPAYIVEKYHQNSQPPKEGQ